MHTLPLPHRPPGVVGVVCPRQGQRIETVRIQPCPSPTGSDAPSPTVIMCNQYSEVWKRAPEIRKQAAPAEMHRERDERSTSHRGPWLETRNGGGRRGRGRRRDPAQKCQDWGTLGAPGSPVNTAGGRRPHVLASPAPSGAHVHPALCTLPGLSLRPPRQAPLHLPASHSFTPLTPVHPPKTHLQRAFS